MEEAIGLLLGVLVFGTLISLAAALLFQGTTPTAGRA